jgi:hypothetical protein
VLTLRFGPARRAKSGQKNSAFKSIEDLRSGRVCFQMRRSGAEGRSVGLSRIGWMGETPLCYYILREAAVTTNGDRLGPIGGRIVAEVIVTLLQRDPTSVSFAKPQWKPRRSLIELLRFGDSPEAT